MNYIIIGTGNMAWFLAKRLTSAGHQCEGIYGRNMKSAIELAASINTKAYDGLNNIKEEPDLCFMAVSDGSIEQVVKNLSFQQTVLVHTAGSVDIKTITSGAHDCAVLWPIYSIVKNNLPNHREIPCTWEASTDKAKRYIQSLGHGITDILFEANGEQRKWLHLAAVIGNNFTNHMIAICEQICWEQALPFSAIQPIIQQTFELAKRNSPSGIQTGPAIRRDHTTLHKQNVLLQAHPLWQQIYKDVSTSIESMYRDIPQQKAVNN